MTDSASLIELSATAAAAAMAEGAITAADYAEALLGQCAAHAGLNAFLAFDPDAVRAGAAAADRHRRSGGTPGALHGLPIPVKDSINTADLATSAGTRSLADFRPARDAGVVTRLRAAGAGILGKTNLHEISLGWTSNNKAFGAVRNPWDITRIPGGSSGGTAAAVAARMAPLGLAEDTQGSIRVPAALCGIVGLRPTTGRYPNDGVTPITPVFDQVGPHARCVADIALFDRVVSGEPAPIVAAPLPGLRLGLAREPFFTGIDPAVATVVEAAIARLTAAGVVFVDVDLPDLSALADSLTLPIQVHDLEGALTRWLGESGAPVDFAALVAGLSPDVRRVVERFSMRGGPELVPEATYAGLIRETMPRLKAMLAATFRRHGIAALLLPATMVPAPLIGDEGPLTIAGEALPFMTALARNITPGSTAGLPGLVLPAGLTAARLPVGIELDGPAGSDRQLVAVGLAIEAVLGPLPSPFDPA